MGKTLRFEGAPNEVLLEDGKTIRAGGTFHVDDDRAEELLTDPSVDIRDGGEGSKRVTRAELNARAEQLGVPTPSELPSKEAVVAAIEQAEADTGAGPDPAQEG